MHHLSLAEREQIYEDMHGVSATVQETPELISQALTDMEKYLQGIRHKPAYDMAVSIAVTAAAAAMAVAANHNHNTHHHQQQHHHPSNYVQDPKLRLMFLRAVRFDAHKAALQMITFLDWKLKLFGIDKLCQSHITLLDDLDTNAQFMVESGFYQILPGRDTRGRVIVTVAGNYHNRLQRTRLSTLQMVFYMLLAAAEDETNQKMGMVVLLYCLGDDDKEHNNAGGNNDDYEYNPLQSEKRNSIRECIQLARAIPLRSEATHFLTRPNGMQYALHMVAKSIGILQRARIRVHLGTHMECSYALLSFGIPALLLPFTTTDSELKTTTHQKWIQRRKIKEQEFKLVGGAGGNGYYFSGIDLPRRNDVLLGQGKPFQGHPGNQRLLELSEAYLEEYNQANPDGGRTIVARKIIQEIWHPSLSISLSGRPPGSNNDKTDADAEEEEENDDNGKSGRFLKRREDKLKSGWWEEVTEEDVLIEKVCNALRYVRKRIQH